MVFPEIPHDGAHLGTVGGRDTFHFAVIGDTHTHRTPNPAEQSETTLRIIDELNLLRPDFILHAGDSIRGYTTDAERLRLEHTGAKDAFSGLTMPLFPCIGNHDVREEISEGIWREFWGGRWYSFDFADCHFVTLDAELNKDVESVAGKQLEWLRVDLAEHAVGKRVFVTLHRPWWYDYPLHTAEWKRPGGRNDWNQQVDPILRDYDLRAIFTGHRHLFEYSERNGVPHIVAGGAGGDVHYKPELGGMSHYLWVSVRPDEVVWSVIVPGQILAPERARTLNRKAGEHEFTVRTLDFVQEMPWVLHPNAARSGWHHEQEKTNGSQPTFAARLRTALGLAGRS